MLLPPLMYLVLIPHVDLIHEISFPQNLQIMFGHLLRLNPSTNACTGAIHPKSTVVPAQSKITASN